MLEMIFVKQIKEHEKDDKNWVGHHFQFHNLYPPETDKYNELAATMKIQLSDCIELPYIQDDKCTHPHHLKPEGHQAWGDEYTKLWHWWTVHMHQVLIKKFGLLHTKCYEGKCYKDGDKSKICKNGYPFAMAESTTLDARGYVNYRRPNMKSSLVVAHNFNLLLVGGCHINTEYCCSVNVIEYLYKYIYKGADHAFVKLTSEFWEKTCAGDEINQYQYQRYVSASEAAWRILGFIINGERFPSVGVLPIHMAGKDRVVYKSPRIPRSKTVPRSTRREAMRNAREFEISYEDALHSLLQWDSSTESSSSTESESTAGDATTDGIGNGEPLPEITEDADDVPDIEDVDDPTRKCSAQEQYYLRPHIVFVPGELALRSQAAADQGYDILDSSDTGDFPVPKGHVAVSTENMLYAFYHECFSTESHTRPVGKALAATSSRDFSHARSAVYHRKRRRLFRMYVLYPSHGESYYLRMLLSHCPSPLLRDDAFAAADQQKRILMLWHAFRSTEGGTAATFQEACHSRLLADGSKEYIECMQELVDMGKTGRILRQLFVTMIMNTGA